MKIEAIESQIREAGRPRPAVAGARLNRTTLERLAEVCRDLDPRAAQPRIGAVPLVIDPGVPDDQVWLMSDQGEILTTLEVGEEIEGQPVVYVNE